MTSSQRSVRGAVNSIVQAEYIACKLLPQIFSDDGIYLSKAFFSNLLGVCYIVPCGKNWTESVCSLCLCHLSCRPTFFANTQLMHISEDWRSYRIKVIGGARGKGVHMTLFMPFTAAEWEKRPEGRKWGRKYKACRVIPRRSTDAITVSTNCLFVTHQNIPFKLRIGMVRKESLARVGPGHLPIKCSEISVKN